MQSDSLLNLHNLCPELPAVEMTWLPCSSAVAALSFAALVFFRWLPSSVRTACEIGTIMAVVAVLLIHIDRNAVVDMKPNISL